MSGEDAAAAAWTCLYLPQGGTRQGRRKTSQNARQPASGQPSQRERRYDWELEHLGFREGGGREEDGGWEGDRIVLLEQPKKGKGTGDWYSWVLQESGD